MSPVLSAQIFVLMSATFNGERVTTFDFGQFTTAERCNTAVETVIAPKFATMSRDQISVCASLTVSDRHFEKVRQFEETKDREQKAQEARKL